MFEKLWQFSSFLIQKGLKVLEVGNAEKFSDCNIPKIPQDPENLIIRATAKGKPEYISQTIDEVAYKAVKVSSKFYAPDRKESL